MFLCHPKSFSAFFLRFVREQQAGTEQSCQSARAGAWDEPDLAVPVYPPSQNPFIMMFLVCFEDQKHAFYFFLLDLFSQMALGNFGRGGAGSLQSRLLLYSCHFTLHRGGRFIGWRREAIDGDRTHDLWSLVVLPLTSEPKQRLFVQKKYEKQPRNIVVMSQIMPFGFETHNQFLRFFSIQR